MSIPFVDLKAQYLTIREDIDSAIQAVIDNSAFIKGEYVSGFETAFAKAIGAEHCIGVANGTDAIYVVLKTLGIGPGDEVITVANSWISTSETIGQTGATPVFVDIDDRFNIDVKAVEQKITSKTKAIVPVHLYGQPADLAELCAICERHGLFMVEDCAQAHLAEFDSVRVGNFGIAGTFSFYPGKNLGAYGDAGAIVTSDAEFADACRRFANHGALIKHEHTIEGINSRLDGLQAAILMAKLPHLEIWTAARQRHAKMYDELLAPLEGITTPSIGEGRTHVYHLYVIRCEQRDRLRESLSSAGVQSALHYPTPLPLLKAYDHLGYKMADFPEATRAASEILSLPMYAELVPSQIESVANAIAAFVQGKGGSNRASPTKATVGIEKKVIYD